VDANAVGNRPLNPFAGSSRSAGLVVPENTADIDPVCGGRLDHRELFRSAKADIALLFDLFDADAEGVDRGDQRVMDRS